MKGVFDYNRDVLRVITTHLTFLVSPGSQHRGTGTTFVKEARQCNNVSDLVCYSVIMCLILCVKLCVMWCVTVLEGTSLSQLDSATFIMSVFLCVTVLNGTSLTQPGSATSIMFVFVCVTVLEGTYLSQPGSATYILYVFLCVTVLDGTSLSQRGSATSQMQAATTPSWSSPQASLDQDRSLCLAVMWDADRVRWLEEDCVLSGGFICLKSAETTGD